jgi:hypothetical protein
VIREIAIKDVVRVGDPTVGMMEDVMVVVEIRITDVVEIWIEVVETWIEAVETWRMVVVETRIEAAEVLWEEEVAAVLNMREEGTMTRKGSFNVMILEVGADLVAAEVRTKIKTSALDCKMTISRSSSSNSSSKNTTVLNWTPNTKFSKKTMVTMRDTVTMIGHHGTIVVTTTINIMIRTMIHLPGEAVVATLAAVVEGILGVAVVGVVVDVDKKEQTQVVMLRRPINQAQTSQIRLPLQLQKLARHLLLLQSSLQNYLTAAEEEAEVFVVAAVKVEEEDAGMLQQRLLPWVGADQRLQKEIKMNSRDRRLRNKVKLLWC